VNQHDVDLVWQVLEPVRHGFDAFATADGQEQTIDVTLKQPGWWIADERLRQHADHHRDVAARMERLDAV